MLLDTHSFVLYMLSGQNIFNLENYFVFTAAVVSSGNDVSCATSAAK